MTKFNDRDSLMTALAPLSPLERAELLYTGNNRDLVVSYGANVTFYHGNLKIGNSYEERFADLTLTLVERLSGNKPNGLGAFGGRTDPEDHEGKTDPLEITKVTVRRELKEELKELGVDASLIPLHDDKFLPLELTIKDDNYILAKWSGDLAKGKNVTAVQPYCYTYRFYNDVISDLPHDQEKSDDGEIGKIININLFEALKCFGKKGGKFQSKDGRDLSHDYCYPHEYFTTWKIASDEIGEVTNKNIKMVRLAQEVQTSIYLHGHDYKIDFENLAKIMGVKLEDMDKALNVVQGTVQEMQAVMNAISREEVNATLTL